MTMTDLREARDELVRILELTSEPVGVRFIPQGQALPEDCQTPASRRYCQALMEARRGARVLLTPDNVSCPAAAAAFGFRPLPPMLASGEMLHSFGIFGSAEAGKATIDSMRRLRPGEYSAVALGPLAALHGEPSVVVVEGTVEQVMWIALAARHQTGGRTEFSTAILQATCEDATLLPFLTERLNATLGCYGCRDATDMGVDETAVGFPYSMLPAVVDGLRALGNKALPSARSKTAYRALSKGAACDTGMAAQ
ncbi:MAG TPA: DUF169 domain-containing protein [Armatimonadota bacterium]|nr:DUF169 domain-containing protein [Armatimonadota bacterium]